MRPSTCRSVPLADSDCDLFDNIAHEKKGLLIAKMSAAIAARNRSRFERAVKP